MSASDRSSGNYFNAIGRTGHGGNNGDPNVPGGKFFRPRPPPGAGRAYAVAARQRRLEGNRAAAHQRAPIVRVGVLLETIGSQAKRGYFRWPANIPEKEALKSLLEHLDYDTLLDVESVHISQVKTHGVGIPWLELPPYGHYRFNAERADEYYEAMAHGGQMDLPMYDPMV